MPFTGVIFDCDGTLLDTTELIRSSFQEVGRRLCIPIPTDIVERESGVPLRTSLRRLDPDGNHQLMYDIFVAFQTRRLTNERPLPVRPYPGVPETLQKLWKHRFRLGVFSSRQRFSVQSLLGATGLSSYFPVDAVVGPGEVREPKPAPEGIYLLARAWNRPCGELLFVGDGRPDFASAKAAGSPMALAAYGPGASTLNGLQPNFRLNRFSDLLSIVGESMAQG